MENMANLSGTSKRRLELNEKNSALGNQLIITWAAGEDLVDLEVLKDKDGEDDDDILSSDSKRHKVDDKQTMAISDGVSTQGAYGVMRDVAPS